MSGHTAWVLGEQLSLRNPALTGAARILLVESRAALAEPGLHRQKAHLVLSAIRHFADECRAAGWEVDHRVADTYTVGVAAHRDAFSGPEVVLLEPTGRVANRRFARFPGVRIVPGSLMLTDDAEFADWAAGRTALVMEQFYRRQRRRLGVMVQPDGAPVGERWNFDHENRGTPPKGAVPPAPWLPTEDAIDAAVRADLDAMGQTWFGEDGPRLFPATAAEATALLDRFIAELLPHFGPWQDAMLHGRRFMWHSRLAAALNLGLLDPLAAVRAAEARLDDPKVPIASVEGFIRQIIGWREYVFGLARLWRDDWDAMNALDADQPLPDVFWSGDTEMRCLADAVQGLRETSYTHHIQRLMVLGNLMLLLGVRPGEALQWFHRTHIDGHDWVMLPNVIGMALFADGGRMMTKPYAASGAYINRMSDHCRGCRFNPKHRTGPDACPYTTLYWHFLDRNERRLSGNNRMTLALKNLARIDPAERQAIVAAGDELRAGGRL
jgi:deoxyribodipyrimidine photolyase-related protein